MRRFGRLGILTDDTMERTWIASHLWSRIYSRVLNWEKRAELTFADKCQSQHADVQTAVNIGDAATRKSKRQKQDTDLPHETKTYLDVLNRINSLQDLHPLRDIFGAYLLF